ncbi:hypothetical protein A1O3_00851 [Capronia epimyces CBS 606.96]|uniref:Probable cytosolic iron-sulfur protein assembly protein 1 n=1 Tax=Capronia epimyces CBS 606.96 TaxID=1182542 RepID=W9YSQ9_9EURO|nr:uncharacterized protein A1O3_00851 [Capronia epimyces CBS 606.96]EXJ92301.1 hypothetical protein A1O3_00851 [Capronia epimyces CBS 606.96]
MAASPPRPPTTTNPSSPSAPELSLLQVLQSPASGPSRSWQSMPHPDPATPLLASASADKSVNIWSLRDFSLISTINGGHKRSVRTVAWKDFGQSKSSKSTKKERKPVVLGTGSFDANVGIWIWNDDRRWARFREQEKAYGGGNGPLQAQTGEPGQQHPNTTTRGDNVGAEADADVEIDMTRDPDEEDEEWHFSTLLTGPDSEIKSIEFSPPHYSANLLATCSRDKSVWIWEEVEPEEWETIAVLSEHTGDVKCVSWCAGALRGNGRQRTKGGKSGGEVFGQADGDDDVEMEDTHTNTQSNGAGAGTYADHDDPSSEQVVLGSRELLATGSYDDTIRLWRDVEEEGDWICVGVIDSHKGTVWDVKWEGHINYTQLDLSQTPPSFQDADAVLAEFEADWSPRLVSCSDDLTVRVWRRELSEAEKARKAQSRPLLGAAPTGFAGTRLPSVIRPPSSLEHWVEDARLPQVHVRSVYAVDWSRRTGLVVSCGGDGTIAVYKEVKVEDTDGAQPHVDDMVMNGTTGTGAGPGTATGYADPQLPYKLHKMKWTVVAQIEAAHDEYEINHVCWAVRGDRGRRFAGEEVIVSTGDEGNVRIWTLPDHLAVAVESGL